MAWRDRGMLGVCVWERSTLCCKISLKPLITPPRTRSLLVLTSRWRPDEDGAERAGRVSRMKVRCFPAFKQREEMSHRQYPLYRVCESRSASTTTWSTGATTEARDLQRVTAFVLKKEVPPVAGGHIVNSSANSPDTRLPTLTLC